MITWLRTNWISMVLALMLALTVWIVASLEENPLEEDNLAGPVEIDVVGLGPDLVIVNDYPEVTRVRLRAQRTTWRSLSPEIIRASADLSGLGPGTYQVRLKFEIEAPAELVSANPATIRFELEQRRVRSDLPVQLELTGQPAIGFSVGDPTIEPRLVSVQGPRSQVDLISEIRATASLEGLNATFRRQVALVALDSGGATIEDVVIDPSIVNITIPIRQEAGFRIISVIVQTIGRPAPGYYVNSILPSPQRITVQGDPAVIEAMLGYAETEPVDITNLSDDLIVEVGLELPPGVTPIGSPSIEVLISIAAQLSSRTVLDVPVKATGLQNGLAARLSPSEIDVILTGPITLLDLLDPTTDIVVTVNLSGLGPGTYQIEPDVQIAQSDVLVESILPIVVEVTITRDTSPEGLY